MAEPGKWELNPPVTIGEIPRQENDPGYMKTICGVQRMLWTIINVDLNGYIPQDKLDQINSLLEKAFKMGKRMDYRLHEQFKLLHEHEEPPTSEQLVEEIHLLPDGPMEDDRRPRNGKQPGKKVKGKS